MKLGTSTRLSDEQRLDWLRLIRSEKIGPRTFINLVGQFGSAADALAAIPELARRGGGTAPRLCSRASAEKEMAALAAQGARMIALGEPDYPQALAAADSPPPLLTIRGNEAGLSRPMIGIVGARNASAAGRAFTTRLARDLGDAGFIIVSGLARGIDAAAHEASLASGTIAVLAGGLDRIYPSENIPLLDRIQQHGLALTEMPLGWEPRARDFPRRNRIVAGLSLGMVVVEAAVRSGSLISARLANEMGREVMAAPGSPLDPRCEGSNRLLREGATLITSAEHVIEAIAPLLRAPRAEQRVLPLEEEPADAFATFPEDEVRDRIVELLGPSPANVDDIVRMSGAPARTVQLILLELELAGRIERHINGAVSFI